MQVEIGILNRDDGSFMPRAEENYSGPLEVRRYTNKISGQPDPLIKRKDGKSFLHLSTLTQTGHVVRIVGSDDLLQPDTPITELALGETA